MQQAVTVHPVVDRVSFNGVEFNLVRHANAAWLRADQIGLALGYQQPLQAVLRLWRANATEVGQETDLLRVKTLDGVATLRVFSPMGARVLALLSRAPRARAFRQWLATRFDENTMRQSPLSPAQQREIQRHVAERVRFLFGNNRQQGFAQVYSGIKDFFAVGSYKMIPASQFEALVEYVDGYEPLQEGLLNPQTIQKGVPNDEFEHYLQQLRRQGEETRDLEVVYASGRRMMETAMELLRHRLHDANEGEFLF